MAGAEIVRHAALFASGQMTAGRRLRLRVGLLPFIVAASVALSVILGIWGWGFRYEAPPTGSPLGWPAVVFRTLALFSLDSFDVVNGPWQIQVARLLAPVAIATAVLNVVLTSSTHRLHRAAARRLTEHRVVIGPPERVDPYLIESLLAWTAHPIDFGEEPAEGMLNPQVDWTSGDWIDAVAATAARDIVIATGQDERNLELLAELTAVNRSSTPRNQHILVETDDPELALWVSLAMASRHRDRNIEVVSWPDTMARRTAHRLVEIATRAVCESRPVCVAVLGDEIADSMVVGVAEHLAAWGRAAGTPKGRPSTLLVRSGRVPRARSDRVTVEEVNDVKEFDRVTVEEVNEVKDLVRWRPDAAVSYFADPTDTIQLAVELQATVAHCEVLVPSRSRQLLPGLIAVDLAARIRNGGTDGLDLEGPIVRVARERYRLEELGAWDVLEADQKREHIIRIRNLVWGLSQMEDIDLSVGALDPSKAILPTEVAKRLADLLVAKNLELGGAVLNLSTAPLWFQAVGLAVTVNERPTSPGRSPTPNAPTRR